MLYVECYADEAVARILGVPRREIRHEHGKGNIANRLRRLDTWPTSTTKCASWANGFSNDGTPSLRSHPHDHRIPDLHPEP